MSKNNKIITALIIFVFILLFYFLTKNPSTSENNISGTNQNTMSNLPPSKITELIIEDI